MAINVSAGAALISVASPLIQDLAGIGVEAATGAVIALSLANGAGRLVWGTWQRKAEMALSVFRAYDLRVDAAKHLARSERLLQPLHPGRT